MRTFLSFVLGVIACLAMVAAVPSLWVSQNIADEDGYVAFAEPIGEDPAFHRVLSESIAEVLLDNTNLRADFKPVASDAISRITTEVAEEPGFLAAWNETQRRSHQISFGDPRDLPAELDDSSGFAVDLAPLGGFVIEQVNQNLPFTVPSPQQAMVQVNGNPQTQAIERIQETPTYARNGLIVMAVAGILALLVARRRTVVILWLGLGTLAVAGLLKLIMSLAVPELVERNTAPSPIAKALLDTFVARADESFGRWIVILAIGGVVAAVIGGLGRALSGSREPTSTP